jgi:predicted P-loop ATPase
MKDSVLAEAKRLYNLGLAVHWLHPKSKRPVESGWTTGPRKDWNYLKETYHKGLNVGVRLGTPSKIDNKFLGVIDVDVKSSNPKHKEEVQAELKKIVNGHELPEVISGRGNGSRHLYVLTPQPLKPAKAVTSKEVVKVHMPSSGKPSRREVEMLTAKEIAEGFRLRPAWEIGIMGDGQQVVLPPSIHPDSGKPYLWKRNFEIERAFNSIDFIDKLPEPSHNNATNLPEKSHNIAKQNFNLTTVEVEWLPISDKVRNMIMTGEGVKDRSAMLLPIAATLKSAGLSVDEILSVLTDRKYFIGDVGFDHAKTTDRNRAAAWVYKYSVEKVLKENNAEEIFSDEFEPPKELAPEDLQRQSEIFLEMFDWQIDLDYTDQGKKRGTLKNVVLILENLVGKDLFRRNTFAYRDFYGLNTPWGGRKDASITDDDAAQMKHWFGVNHGMEPNKQTIGDAITVIAMKNAFDPVLDWLNALPAWDETPRLDTWLKDHFHGQGDEDYLAQVFRKWVCAMVLRVLKPGAKFDWIPIFEGVQGAGKSSFGRILVGEDFFLDWLPDLADKDSALALQGIWAVELGELASLRKNEIETVKAFLTRTVDKVRPPFGQRWIESKRRCVFFGTTNFDTYLRDDSGNRRFKPVKVGKLDFDQLREDREQLFAEAKWLLDKGFEAEPTLEIEGEAKLYEAQIQKDKMVQDDSALMTEELFHFIQDQVKKPIEDQFFNFDKFKMRDLFEGGLGALKQGTGPLKNWKYDSRTAQYAAKALKNVGGKKWKSHGVIYWKVDK